MATYAKMGRLAMDDYGLGRLHVPDERDKAFPMRAIISAEPPRKWRYHQTGPVLNQGDNPFCVGASWQQWLASDPIRTRSGLTMEAIYHAAQQVDEWPGAGYAGTSVRAGAQVLETEGHRVNRGATFAGRYRLAVPDFPPMDALLKWRVIRQQTRQPAMPCFNPPTKAISL